MPYQKLSDLPASVQDLLPEHAQEIFLNAFNNAWKEYRESGKRSGGSSHEETAYRVAWAAVKKTYLKDAKTGHWKLKGSKMPA
jgi:cation transport regulator